MILILLVPLLPIRPPYRTPVPHRLLPGTHLYRYVIPGARPESTNTKLDDAAMKPTSSASWMVTQPPSFPAEAFSPKRSAPAPTPPPLLPLPPPAFSAVPHSATVMLPDAAVRL